MEPALNEDVEPYGGVAGDPRLPSKGRPPEKLMAKAGGRIRSFRAGAGMPQSAPAQAGGLTDGYRSAMERGTPISITT